MSESVLKGGSHGEAVTALQKKLQQLGCTVQPDGQFGPATRAAVEDLQAVFGYDVDGVVGSATAALIDQQLGFHFNLQDAAALRRALTASSSTPPKRVLQHGMDGYEVRLLQRKLGALGFEVGVDGKFGPATEKAVRALQKTFGYDVDGIAGIATEKLIAQQLGLGWNASLPA